MSEIAIAVVEDDDTYALQLQEYLSQYSREFAREVAVCRYPSGVAFLEQFTGQFDIVLLDIDLPELDGMETARRLRKTDADVLLLFVTNMAQYAIRGYEVDAIDYILKPISYFSFSQRFSRAVSRMKKPDRHYLVVNHKSGSRKLNVEQILYVESQGHNLIYHTTEGGFTTAGTMKDAEQTLLPFQFFRCNKGYLVALRHVDGIQEGCAMVGDELLLISRARKNAFMEALTNYIGGATV